MPTSTGDLNNPKASGLWQDNQSGKPFPVAILVGSICGGVAIISLLMYLIYRRKKSSDDEESLNAMQSQVMPNGQLAPPMSKSEIKAFKKERRKAEKAFRKALAKDPSLFYTHFPSLHGQSPQLPPLQGETYKQRFPDAPAYTPEDFQPVKVADQSQYWSRLEAPGFGRTPQMQEVDWRMVPRVQRPSRAYANGQGQFRSPR